MANDNTENLTLRMRVLGMLKAARDLKRGQREVRKLGDEADRADHHIGRTDKSWKLFTGNARNNSGLLSKVRGLFGGLGKSMGSAADEGEKLSETLGGGGGGGSTVRGSLGPLSGISGTTVIALWALAAVMGGALLAAAVALAASLTVAVGALIALGVAATAFLGLSLAVGLGIAAAAAKRFQQQMNMSGTAAYALNRAAGRTFDVLNHAFGPGVDQIFLGLASLLQKLRPLFQALQGPVTALGASVGWLMRSLGDILNQPAVIAGLQQFITGLSGFAAPIAQMAAVLLPFFIQLANAALPVIVQLLSQAAAWMTKWLGNGQAMVLFQQFLAFAIPHLQAWWNLIKALAPIFLGLLRVAAPFGLQLVQWLTIIAQKMGAWMNTAQGQAMMKNFFAQVMPLARQIMIFIGHLLVIFLQLLPIIAPVMTALIGGLNWALGLVQSVLGFFHRYPGILHTIGTILGYVFSPILLAVTYVKWLIGKIQDLINWIGKIHWPSPPDWITPGGGGGIFGTGVGPKISASGLVPHLPGRAGGGPVSRGQSYLVGEEGPEVYRPNSSGEISPHDRAFAAPPPGAFYSDVTVVMPDGSVLARESVRAARRDKALR